MIWSQTEIRLDLNRFAGDEATGAVAQVLATHAEKRRAEYGQEERPLTGLLRL